MINKEYKKGALIEISIENEPSLISLPKSYSYFLNVCNGGRFGAIDLWSNELILDNQYRVTEMVGCNENWFCIGQALYEPLVVKLDNEDIYLFYQGYENEIDGKYFGVFKS